MTGSKTSEVRLEPINREHLSYLVMSWNAGLNWAANKFKKKTSMAEQHELLDANQLSSCWILVNHGPIGLLEQLSYDQRSRCLQFRLSFEDRQIAKQTLAAALNLTLRFFFEDVGCSKVSSLVSNSDAVMLELYRQFGFQSEVRWRQHSFVSNTYTALNELALFVEDWKSHGKSGIRVNDSVDANRAN